jgi:hypothetical protein
MENSQGIKTLFNLLNLSRMGVLIISTTLFPYSSIELINNFMMIFLEMKISGQPPLFPPH